MKTIPVLAQDEIQEDRPLPSRNHSRVAQNLGVLLDRLRGQILLVSDTGYTGDLSFSSPRRQPCFHGRQFSG